MKYISIDIETTGLNPDTCQLLSLGAIIEDTENKLSYEDCPKFHGVIAHKFIQGEPFALNMNTGLINIISQYHTCKTQEERDALALMNDIQFYDEGSILPALDSFAKQHGFTSEAKLVAGANFAFDRSFLSKFPGYRYLNIARRPLEPSHYTIDWKNDKIMPSLFQCKERLGLEGGIAHDALADAWDVIEVLRTQY